MNFTVVNAVPKAITLDEVKQATLKDNVFQQVVKAVSYSHWGSIHTVAPAHEGHQGITKTKTLLYE